MRKDRFAFDGPPGTVTAQGSIRKSHRKRCLPGDLNLDIQFEPRKYLEFCVGLLSRLFHKGKENIMSDSQQPDLTSQFRELGENLKSMFQSAWESEEATKLKEEMKEGLTELGTAANQALEDFNVSEAGQKIKAEAEDFKTRVESGEVETKARDEISKALNLINAELQKAIGSFSKPKEE